ncbi:Protein TOXD, partial [Tolypocladium ophioglossoides CBS 100239]
THVPRIKQAIQSDHAARLVQTSSREVPSPGPNQVLIRIAAVLVALNPCDWKMSSAFPCPGAGCGSNYAGLLGDRISGAVHAKNPINPLSGAYAEYSAACVDKLWRIPNSMSWTDAAAIGPRSIGTVGLAAWGSRQAERETRIVYGASTANGTMAIQILKLQESRGNIVDLIIESLALETSLAALYRVLGRLVDARLFVGEPGPDGRSTIPYAIYLAPTTGVILIEHSHELLEGKVAVLDGELHLAGVDGGRGPAIEEGIGVSGPRHGDSGGRDRANER